MYVLIYSGNELLNSDNEVASFATHDEAYAEMLSQFDGAAADDGILLPPELLPPSSYKGDVYGCDLDGDGIGWVGYITDNDAYLDHNELKWSIFKVPEVKE